MSPCSSYFVLLQGGIPKLVAAFYYEPVRVSLGSEAHADTGFPKVRIFHVMRDSRDFQ